MFDHWIDLLEIYEHVRFYWPVVGRQTQRLIFIKYLTSLRFNNRPTILNKQMLLINM